MKTMRQRLIDFMAEVETNDCPGEEEKTALLSWLQSAVIAETTPTQADVINAAQEALSNSGTEIQKKGWKWFVLGAHWAICYYTNTKCTWEARREYLATWGKFVNKAKTPWIISKD